MKKVAIVGAGGLVGQALTEYFRQDPKLEIHALMHRDLEITDKEKIERRFREILPDAVINCAAILKVDFCEENPEQCYAVNRDGAKNLMEALAQIGKPATFVQISTSEVFGRTRENCKIEGYTEDDQPRPITVYQKSKKEAEDIVKGLGEKYPEIFPKWIIARTGWLYGPGRKTFVEQFLADIQKGDEIVAISDQWRSPTNVQDFAHELAKLIFGKSESGIYHIVNQTSAGEATTLDVIKAVSEYLGRPAEKLKIRLVSQGEFFKVPRAPSNVLKSAKLPALRDWRYALREYLETYYPEL